jgi:hypothetical protein
MRSGGSPRAYPSLTARALTARGPAPAPDAHRGVKALARHFRKFRKGLMICQPGARRAGPSAAASELFPVDVTSMTSRLQVFLDLEPLAGETPSQGMVVGRSRGLRDTRAGLTVNPRGGRWLTRTNVRIRRATAWCPKAAHTGSTAASTARRKETLRSYAVTVSIPPADRSSVNRRGPCGMQP